MGDLVVATVIAVVGLWVVVHEELAHRGLLPSQQKKPRSCYSSAEAEDRTRD